MSKQHSKYPPKPRLNANEQEGWTEFAKWLAVLPPEKRAKQENEWLTPKLIQELVDSVKE